jgi:uncharacterized protein (TIGR01777 family)
MRILISGATGFIGSHLVSSLHETGHDIITLGRGSSSDFRLDAAGDAPAAAFEGAGAVIHLAGEPVAQRWTPEVKRRIRESRVMGTERLVHGLSITRNRPGVLVCASAVGYYGDRGDEVLTEASAPGKDFLAEVCRQWEEKADLAGALGLRVVKVRVGVVLGSNGGALKKMLPAFKMGVGGRLGNGRQWMPWIHVADIAGIFRHAVESSVTGVLNGCSPGVVTNAEFTKALGHALGRPTLLPTPGFALKLLFGEMAEMILDSQRVTPRATRESGYKFKYPDLAEALKCIYSRR